MSLNDLNNEKNRLNSFKSNWPHVFINPKILAKIGFYYIGPYDSVKCYFCNVHVSRWEMGDNEVNEHFRWSPDCPLLKRHATSNIPLEPISELSQLLLTLSNNDVNETNTVDETNTVERQTHYKQRIYYYEFAIESTRLHSFEKWPKALKQKPEQLADAGFFYTQIGDRVICFSCGVGLHEWDETDDPWEQHALWYDSCNYLRLVKDVEFIESVKEKFNKASEQSSSIIETATSTHKNNSNTSSSISSTTDEHQKLVESRLCRICFSSEFNSAFFPCGHVTACIKCALSVIKCPLCQKPYESVKKVFIS